MKKWINRGHSAKRNTILLILTTAALMAGVYLLIMYQLGNRIVNEVIDQQLAQLDQQLQQPVENDPSVILSEAKNPDTPENASNVVDGPNVILSAAKNPDTPKNSPSVILSEAKNLGTPKNDPNIIQQQPAITVSELETVKDKVTPNDKVYIANMVLKKLTSADIEELMSMLPGGLTPEEKKRAKEIAYSRFSGDEISTIIEMYVKYMQ